MVEFYDCIPDDFFSSFFPRNLSYSEESYIDNFSTCAPFVKVPTHSRVLEYLHSRIELETEIQVRMCDEVACIRDSVNCENDDDGSSVDPEAEGESGKGTGPECEDVSEEGIFVNMMDDLDSVDSPGSRVSVGSDPSYFSLDSVASPEEAVEKNSCDQDTLNEALAKELEGIKLEARRKMSDSALPSRSLNTSGNTDNSKASDLKKVGSDGSLSQTKLAQLKIEMSGSQVTSTGAQRYILHVPEGPVYEEPEFNINKSELRKSSSLKTNKTPPGTPSRKKMVRFADAMGLDLESIRHVIDAENPPRIPASAISDLKVGVEQDRHDVGSRYLDLCFQQPCVASDFIGRVMANKLSLENCLITDMSITGVVRVANIGFHKCVRVRYSINNWVTFYDVMASYVQNSCDGATDRFSFTIVAPANVGPGSRISFAVSYTVNDTVYWDSNNGNNYEILCYAKTTPTDLEASWVHFV